MRSLGSRDLSWQCANSVISDATQLKISILAYNVNIDQYSNFGVNEVNLGSFGAFFERCVFCLSLIGGIARSHFD